MRSKFIIILLPLVLLAGVIGVMLLPKTSHVAAADACKTADNLGLYDFSAQTAFWEEKEIPLPGFARNIDDPSSQVLGDSVNPDRWIEVDISEQKLKAWEGNTLFLETPISSGLPGTPTPIGEFRVWLKLRFTKMEGGRGRYYYYLPNVPYTMFFQNESVPNWRGYGLHGTYWHNDFGTRRSHGCVNLPTPIAERIFYWVGPVLPDGKRSVNASADNPGTRIVIHE